MGVGATASNGATPPNIVVQFGGQTAINLSQSLNAAGMQDMVLGSDPEVIDNATDRGRFELMAASNGLPLPPGGTATDTGNCVGTRGEPRLSVARASELRTRRTRDGKSWMGPNELERYFNRALRAVPGQTILVDRYFQGIEVEVDAVCDGEDVLVPRHHAAH